MTNLKEQLKRVCKLFLPILYELYENFLGPKKLLKTQTFEKRQAFHWKKIWRLFSRIIERQKAQETKYKGPQAIFTIAL